MKGSLIPGYLLSTLAFLAAFLLVQYLTYEVFDLHVILNHALIVLLFVFFSWVLPRGFGIIGGCLTWLIILVVIVLEGFYFDHLMFLTQLILGVLLGYFLKKRWYKLFVLAFGCLLLIFWWDYDYYVRYTPSDVVPDSNRITAAQFNEYTDSVLSLSGKRLSLSQDTVYLVNMTFYHCKPCRIKKKILEELAVEFKNKPFRIITIHSFEKPKYFYQYYATVPDAYHDFGFRMKRFLQTPGGPFELIFNKKGCEIRRFSGLGSEMVADYTEKTRELIKKLVHEK